MSELEEAEAHEASMVLKVLNAEFYAFDIDEPLTVREYLSKLLLTLLEKGESFNGKRPLGNSGWEGFLLIPCIEAGAIQGSVDRSDPEYPLALGYDNKEFRQFRSALIYRGFRR